MLASLAWLLGLELLVFLIKETYEVTFDEINVLVLLRSSYYLWLEQLLVDLWMKENKKGNIWRKVEGLKLYFLENEDFLKIFRKKKK